MPRAVEEISGSFSFLPFCFSFLSIGRGTLGLLFPDRDPVDARFPAATLTHFASPTLILRAPHPCRLAAKGIIERGLVLYRGMDRRSSFSCIKFRWHQPERQIRSLVPLRHALGQHRHAGRVTSADYACVCIERAGTSYAPRCAASSACSPAARLQKDQISFSHHGDRLFETRRRRPRLLRTRGRLFLVRGHLKQTSAANLQVLPRRRISTNKANSRVERVVPPRRLF